MGKHLNLDGGTLTLDGGKRPLYNLSTACGNKEVPQTFFHESPYSKKWFTSFDFVPLAILHLAILGHHKRRSVEKYW